MRPCNRFFLFSLVFFVILMTSCGSLKSLQSPASSGSSNTAQTSSSLDNANISQAPKSIPLEETSPAIQDSYTPTVIFNNTFTITKAKTVQFKYAIRLNTEVEQLGNKALYSFIDDWWGTPYHIGGLTQRGVDCSAFVQNLDAAIYEIALPRTAKEQFASCHHISRQDLREGDLLFFKTKGHVSHVGVYLQNNKFVHASTSGGVMISDMAEPYWSKRFLSAGRPNKSLVIGR